MRWDGSIFPVAHALVVMERTTVMTAIKSPPPKSEYLEFEFDGYSDSGKTEIWCIYSKRSNDLLGVIKWFGRWRQYAFFPEPGTIWNIDCLSTVNLWIGVMMRERQRNA